MKLRRPWTEKEESDLLTWFSEGKSLCIIAVRLKRSLNAVQMRFYQLQRQQKPVADVSPAGTGAFPSP